MPQCLILMMCMIMSVHAKSQTLSFTSGLKQTTLVELYTSEGCSSCPPADHFISQFKHSNDLWQQYIPMAFHVDYWDYLGWQDPFAQATHSERQRNHHKQGSISSVYTPGFVVNGQEWTGFFKALRWFPETDQFPGRLHLEINQQRATIQFKSNKTLTYHLAVLGIGLTSQVNTGENAGHELEHDFVVLHHQQQDGQDSALFNLPLIVKHHPKEFAIIAWVTEAGSLPPIQAVGGYLPDGIIKKI